MSSGESTLFQMLVEDLNSTFLQEYSQRTGIIYREAHSRSFGDPAIHDAFKPYYYGQTRFALHQSMFIRVAEDCGLAQRIARSPENGFPTAVVTVGRFFFTDHYGETAQDTTYVDASLVRQQHARINLSLIQPSLFEPRFDDARLVSADHIYANLIHGARGHDFSASGFLRIAFPCLVESTGGESADQKVRFVENYRLSTVLASILAREAGTTPAVEPRVDTAVPTIRRSQS